MKFEFGVDGFLMGRPPPLKTVPEPLAVCPHALKRLSLSGGPFRAIAGARAGRQRAARHRKIAHFLHKTPLYWLFEGKLKKCSVEAIYSNLLSFQWANLHIVRPHIECAVDKGIKICMANFTLNAGGFCRFEPTVTQINRLYS